MSYTNTLIGSAKIGLCPGCGPTLENISSRYDAKGIINKYCTCCGWTVWVVLNGEGGIEDAQFSSMPPDLDGTSRFTCAIDHPEHREVWPQPEPDYSQPDPFTSEEIMQELISNDGYHAYLTTPSETCGNCGRWGSHKVVEDRPNFYGHPYTAAICCDCFQRIFGPLSHNYDKVIEPVIINED